ncbi:probable disease resistance protein At1g61180 [Quercus lobata]|uniref:probable disease resistance protein At1g61180 n=1 Tax=Quercus lobata TaxID=97700 RepID=UPI0012460648|nr:probable disease resistance protein At1g61180 [Quercus lobata]
MKIISLVVDIGGNLVAPMRKHFCYLSYCNCNIKNLKDQFQKLGDKRAGVQLEIDVAKQNRELIAPEVESWVEKVDNISEVLRDGQFDKVSYPPPPRGIATSSKEGFKVFESRIPVMKEVLTALRDDKINMIAICGMEGIGKTTMAKECPPPRGIATSSKEGFKVFESRIPVMIEVLTALRDDKINMIAICGMEGIGKTTMAKEVAKKAKDDNLFDEVVMVVVSRKKDLSKIEDQIAMMRHREINFENVLVILDNVLEELNLKGVGIPYKVELNSCKILLTYIKKRRSLQSNEIS